MDHHYLQEYINNLPETQDYGVEYLNDNGWLPEYFSKWTKEHLLFVPDFLTYLDAVKKYNSIDDKEIRVVRYSRYLVQGVPIVYEVRKWKKK